MPRTRFQITLLVLAIALALSSLAFIPSPTHAQTPAAVPISLPAQSLGSALNELARQARLQLMVHPDLVADKQAPAVSGSLTPRQALDRVLAGSGLMADIRGAEVTIRRVSDAAESSVTTLAEMKVTGAAINPGVTEGIGSYTTSQSSYGKGQSLKELPQTVTVMTRQRIDDQQLKTLDDLMIHTPGVTVQQENTVSSSFYSRGFKITSFQIDGNSPMYGEGGLAYGLGTSQLDLAMFDSIEILRGSDALYGTSGEPGGAINLVRKKPTKQFQVKALAHAGSWNNYRGELDVGGSIIADGRIRGRLVGVYEDRKYFYDFGKSDKQLVYGVVEADVTDSTLLTFGADYTHQDFGSFNQFGLPRYSNGEDIGLRRSYYLGGPDDRWLRKNNKQFVRIDQAIGTN